MNAEKLVIHNGAERQHTKTGIEKLERLHIKPLLALVQKAVHLKKDIENFVKNHTD